MTKHDEDDLPDRLLQAALRYASHGYRVLPLRPGTKIPIEQDWQINATTDPEQIVLWWTDTPRANIGLATGRESDLWVLDVDVKDGAEGERSLAKLQAKNKDLPPTRVIRTASGGLHLYFRFPEGEGEWRNSVTRRNPKTGKRQGPLYPGLDVRADGGQVVAPPSVMRDGGRYKRRTKNDVAKIPGWLSAKTRHVQPLVERRPSIDPATLGEGDRSRLERWTIATVAGVTSDLKAMADAATADARDYKGPPWNQGTYNAACRLLEVARAPWSPLSEQDAYDVLFESAPRDRGFTDREVDRIWGSASKKVDANDPLPIPEAVAGPYMIPIPEGDDRRDRLDPDSFFQKGEGLLTERLADLVMDDLAIGIDGTFWSYGGGVWAPNPKELQRRVTRALGNRYRPAHLAAVEDVVETSPRVPRLSADPNPDLINTRSGMLDWRTGALLAHDSAYLSTVQLPVDWDPDATSPRFDAWLERAVSLQTRRLVWELIGYLAMSGNPLQIAVLLYGEGGNGKGTFLRLMLALLGYWNVSALTLRQITDDKFAVAQMLGKIANVAGDIDPRYLRDTSRFKAITGEDLVEAQHKYRDPFRFVNWAVPVFSANDLWRSHDTTEGYLRRWVTIPFSVPLRGSDVAFREADLHAEAPGILAHGVRALRDLMDRGGFDMLGDAADLQRQFAEESDLIRLWVREDDHVVAAEAGQHGMGAPYVNRTLLHRTFRNWARESGHGEMASTSFFKRLRRMGFREERTREGYVFYGIRLDVVSGMIPQTAPLPRTAADWALSGPGDAED